MYKPNHLPPGKTFLLTIAPPQSFAGNMLTAWFTARVQADLQQRGARAQVGSPQTNPDGALILLVPYKNGSGEDWTAMYAAAVGPDGAQFCSMVSNLPLQETTPYIRSGATLFGEIVKKAREAKNPPPSPGIRSASSPAMSPSSSNQPPSGGPVTRDINSQIVGIFHEGRGTITPTGYQYLESADLLLSDGWEYSGLTGPPEELNMEVSRHADPQKWHRWRQQGGAVYIEDSGGWSKLDGDMVRPLESGASLGKNLIHRSAQTFGGMGSFVGTDRIVFYRDGRFERSANVLAGTGTVQASGGFSAGASSVTNRNGTTSSSSGTYSGSGNAVTTHSRVSGAGGAGAATGTYKVSGYTLELDCTNGQVQRFLAFYPFPGKPQIFIGNITFNAQ